jgi:hypothetical protein
MKLLFVILVVLQSTLAAASDADVQVRGRTFYGSPSYYSTTESDSEVTLRASLPWGSIVYLHHGYGGKKLDQSAAVLDWQSVRRVEMTAAAPWVWKVKISKVLHYRSSDELLTHLQFVFNVIYPDGHSEWLRGTESRMGFYQARLLPAQPYAPGSAYPGPLTALKFEVIER